MTIKVDLSKYDNSWFNPGKNITVRFTWYFVNMLFFKTLFPFSSIFKARLLNIFGAKIGKGVIIKPNVNIKYPWHLEIGDYCWIGEGVWIDNLALIKLGTHKANECELNQTHVIFFLKPALNQQNKNMKTAFEL